MTLRQRARIEDGTFWRAQVRCAPEAEIPEQTLLEVRPPRALLVASRPGRQRCRVGADAAGSDGARGL